MYPDYGTGAIPVNPVSAVPEQPGPAYPAPAPGYGGSTGGQVPVGRRRGQADPSRSGAYPEVSSDQSAAWGAEAPSDRPAWDSRTGARARFSR